MLNLNYYEILEEYELVEDILVSCKMSCTNFKDLEIYYIRVGIQPYENDNIGYITLDYTDLDIMIDTYKKITEKINNNMEVEE